MAAPECKHVIAGFLHAFLEPGEVDSRLPVRCSFAHKPRSAFWAWLFDREWIPDVQEVYFIIGDGPGVQFLEARRCSMQDVRRYYTQRDAWEFMDCYIGDQTVSTWWPLLSGSVGWHEQAPGWRTALLYRDDGGSRRAQRGHPWFVRTCPQVPLCVP